MKLCYSCFCEKPLDAFYADKKSKDGRQGLCRECRKARSTLYRQQFPEKAKESKRISQSKPAGKLARKNQAKRYLLAHPERKRCHNLVGHALRRGKMLKMPCSICGDIESDAHHEDYSKPLDVICFCRQHHKDRHMELASLGRDPDAKM